MPRTAPGPNMVAIPGMNPGNIVAGGGGDAGGGSGGSGKGGKGGKGPGPGEGREDAEGGGQGAGDCGTGAAGGCTTHSAGASAGDPVDISTGAVFTRANADLDLDGIIRVFFERKYSSTAAARDVGLGYGWCFTFDWRFVVTRHAVDVHHMGKVMRFVFRHHPRVAVGDGGWMLRIVPGGYVLDTNDGFFHEISAVDPQRGTFRLEAIRHRSGSRILLSYDDRGRLTTITEATGRPIHLRWDEQHIVQLSMTEPVSGYTIAFGRYEYDDRGDLVRFIDAGGYSTEYAYDDQHRLIHHTNPNRLRFYFRYGSDGRCVESWGEYLDHGDPALDPSAPRVLRDGTPIKGIHHVRLDYADALTQVVDSARLRTYHLHEDGRIERASAGQGVTTRVFNYRGDIESHTSPEGHTWQFEWDIRGRLTKAIDPTGASERYLRNAAGDVVANVFSDGTSVERRVDSRGNPSEVTDAAGNITFYEWDERNLMVAQVRPDGTRETYEADAYGNLSRIHFANGKSEAFEWDYFGRVVRHMDVSGVVTEYSYTDAGQLVRKVDSSGVGVLYGYDPAGNLISYTDEFGTIQLQYGGLNWLCARTFPNGETERFLYNHEGWLTREINERGETRTIEHDSVGAVVKDTLFDGRIRTFEHDAESRVVAAGDLHGPVRNREVDAFGNLVHVVFEDDTEEFYEYDQHGRLTAARGPGGTVQLVRDARGAVVQEVQTSEGVLAHVSRVLDTMGRPRKLRLTDGEEFEFARDVIGQRSVVKLPNGGALREERNQDGALVRLTLPEGASISSDLDGGGRLRRRWVEAPGTSINPSGASEPHWVGASPPTLVVEKHFTYDRGSPNPITKSDSSRGLVNYRYDSRERLLALEDGNGDGEHFAHDVTSNVYEDDAGAPGRSYGAGDRLLVRGNARYEYDPLGQLVKKVLQLADGGQQVWIYEWNLRQRLGAVVRPDGVRVEFAYDPFSRRTFKHVHEPNAQTGVLEVTRSTHYVWNDDQLIQERQLEWLSDSSIRETVTTYLYADVRVSPFAQQRTVRHRGQETVHPWLYLVNGQSEAPEELIDGAGGVHARIDRSAYGVSRYRAGSRERTAIGFIGQFYDEETGLYYNRERYYDPEAGRYISHDPVNTRSGTNLYHYTPNPIGYCDPLGLEKHGLSVSVKLADGTKVSPPGNPLTSGKSETYTPGKDKTNGPSDWDAHTEPQAMNWLKTEHGDNLEGAQVNMKGESPPCAQCSKRMRDFANETGATVNYEYPVKKTVQYKPGEAESPKPIGPNKNDEGVKNLCKNYNEQHDRTLGVNEQGDEEGFGQSGEKKKGKANYEPPPNPHPSVTATNPLWASYQSEKGYAQP